MVELEFSIRYVVFFMFHIRGTGPRLPGSPGVVVWLNPPATDQGPVFRRIHHQQTRAIDCLWNGSQERVDALSSIEDTWHIPATKTPAASALQVPALGVHVSNLTRDVC